MEKKQNCKACGGIHFAGRVTSVIPLTAFDCCDSAEHKQHIGSHFSHVQYLLNKTERRRLKERQTIEIPSKDNRNSHKVLPQGT